MNFTGLLSRTKFFVVKNAPQLLTALGIACYGASVYTAIKGSKKYEDRIADDVARLKELKQIVNNGGLDDIPVKETRKEMLKTTLHIAGTTLKTYGVSLIFFTGGTTCILSANNIMHKRQAALAAAYSALNNSFAKYRERVAQKYGDDEERAIRQGAEIIEDKKTGEKIYKQIEEPIYDWGVMYDETCLTWNKDQSLSVQAAYLDYIRSSLQQKLESEGHLFLIDVYKQLGVNLLTLDDKKLQGSRVVGWLYSPDHPSYIDFGIKDEFGNKTENYYKCLRDNRHCIYIHLNPEGDILTGNEGRPTFVDFLKGKK